MKNIVCLFWFFLTATFSGFGQNVTFSSSRGFYQSPLQLTLTTNLSEGTIRYTIDGSTPTTSSGLIYTDAIPINTTTVIRAIGYNTTTTTPVATNSYLYLTDILTQPTTVIGWPNNSYPLGSGSATAIHDYEMDPDVVNNPAYTNSIKTGLISIPTMSLVLDKNDFWDLYEGETKHPTSVEIFYPDGTKEQFNCDLEAHSHDRLKRSLKLGFNASTNTNLLKSAPYNNAGTASTFNDTKIVLRAGNNRSWARNWNPDRTCYTRDEWYRVSQQAISGTGGRGTFVHLYVNGLYWGLYNPVERTDNGMLSHYFGGAFADWMSLDHDGIRDGDPSRFNYLTGTLINQDMSIATNYSQLKSYLDVSKFCDYLIVSWMMGMTDWPGNNFHGGNRTNPAAPFFYNAWDAEWSFDVTNGSNQGAWVHPQFRNTTTGTATIAKIWHAARRNSEFMQLFADRVYKHCFNSGALTDAASRTRWALINGFINTAIIAESARWGDALNDGITRTRDTHWTPEINRVDGLMNGNVVRFINALQEQGYYPTVTAPAFNQEGGSVATGFQLLITNPNPSGTVYYSIDGSDPKTAEGAVGPGATAYTAPVSIASNLTVKARIQRDGVWSSLHEVSFTVSGLITGLYINEFLASNTKKPDENGEFDDWIEIYNATSQPIDIGGLYITDLLSNPTQYQIPVTNPALTTIPAKGYLLLWADGQPAQGPLHVTIKLSKGGEAIGLSQLVGSTPTLIDSYTFGPQKDDVSVGRFPDGTATFKEFFKPTPGSKNSIPFRVNLLINEILAVNQSSTTDETGEHDPWIELYNNNNEAVDIGGMYLSNTIGNPSLWKIPSTNAAQTTIPAKGYLKLWADNQPDQGILHVGFTLSETGGQIVLADIVGPDVSLSDTLRYATQTANVSVGRFPDASKQVRLFSTPTPGATNTIPPLSNLFINEFMASNSKKPDEYGEFDDWIELYNNGTQAVDVGGLYITDDLTNPAKYQIPTTNPALTTIPANGFLLIWADDQAAQGVLHVGFKLSAGGEQIGLFQPNGTGTLTLDSRTFGAQVTDVSSGREQDGAATFVSFTTPTPGATNYTNHPPVVANAIPDQNAITGTAFSFALATNTFTDPDADPLTHAASLGDNASLPAWLSFNAPTRTFSGTPPSDSPPSLILKVTATDGRGGSVSGSFMLSIAPAPPANTAPLLAPIGSQTTTVGQLLSFTAQATDADTPAQTLTYAVAGAPSATIHPATGAFAWTPATAGTFSVSITVTDNGTPALSAQQLVSITVKAALPLQQTVVSYSLMNADNEQEIRVMSPGEVVNLATLPTRNLNIRANTSPSLVGSVKMVLSGRQSRTQTETGAPYALFGDNNGNYNVWLPALGNYSLTTTPYSGGSAQGTAGAPLTVSFSVTNQAPATNHPPVVANAIPDQNAITGTAFSFALATNTFTDPDADPLTYAATLGDNTSLPAWLSFNAPTRTFSGTPPSDSPPSLILKVTATDGRGGSVSGSFMLSIAPAPPANTAPLLAPIGSQTTTVGQLLSFTAQATDADTPAQTLTYAVAGAPSATIHPATGAFAWTPATAGTFSVSITVTDNGTPALSAQQLVSITVKAALPLQQTVVSYSLMNADNEQEIRVMSPGEVINLATLPTRNLNIRANTSPSLVGSVKMVLSGRQSRTQTETGAPYALFGDNNGNYNVWLPALGNYSLTTTPYSGGSAQGTAGAPLTVSFSVINQAPAARLSGEVNPEATGMIVTCYPNPFAHSFTLRLQNKPQGKLPLSLYDANGRDVFQLDDVQPEQTIRLGKELVSGIYILQLGTGRTTRRYKLIKVH